MLLPRLAYGASAMPPSAALEITTCGGAQVLGPSLTRDVFVNGKQVVADGQITTVGQRALAARQNQQMYALQGRV